MGRDVRCNSGEELLEQRACSAVMLGPWQEGAVCAGKGAQLRSWDSIHGLGAETLAHVCLKMSDSPYRLTRWFLLCLNPLLDPS